MLPQFPDFAPIHLDHQVDIERLLLEYPPYSDFNFLSLWAWDTDGERQVSLVNGCLVVRFTDYITSEPFYSFLAGDRAADVAQVVFPHLIAHGQNATMKLVPESAAFPLSKLGEYRVTNDTDNDDYILSIDDIIRMEGRKFDPKRNFINRFNREYATRTVVRELDVTIPETQTAIRELFAVWEKNSGRPAKDTQAERTALDRLLAEARRFRLKNVGVFVDGVLVAFSVNELAHHGYGYIHFEKANTEIVGSFPFLKQATALALKGAGCTLINYEQDLGIEGLRKAKRSYHPVSLLKKYTVCYTEGTTP